MFKYSRFNSEMMRIHVKSGLYGASKASGTSVIIDVFRASSTICAILGKEVKYIIPVKFLKEARQLKKEHSDYLLIGERQGLKPKGFDCGNSPHEVSTIDLDKKVVVFRSSAGSHAIIEAKKSCANELLIGGFVNARAIIDYIQDQKPDEATLVAVGTLEPRRKAVEDQLCAEYLKSLLIGKELSFSEILKEIQLGDGAKRLRKLGQRRDLRICLQLNLYDNIVPKVKVEQGSVRIKRTG